MKVVALKDVCRITNGGTPKSGVESLWHGGVAWLTPAEMGKRLTPYIAQTARTISQDGLANSSAKLVPPCSVILSTRAPIGHLAINEAPMAFNQGCRGLTPHDQLDTKYLYYFLLFSRQALDNLGTGTTFKELSSTSLANFQIPLPPLDEQRRIVAVLDKAFAGIATATTNAQKNLTNARALFESYLRSTFGANGEGWIEQRLGEICGLQNGFAFQSSTFKESGVPVLRISNIQNETIEARRLVYVNPQDYRENLERFKVEKGALLIAMSGATTGKVGILDEDETYYLNQRVGKFEPTALLDKHYLFYYLITKVEENLSISAGSAQPNLSTAQIKDFVIPLPPIEQQRKIVESFGEMHDLCEQLKSNVRQKHNTLLELKQSLLQKAFVGDLI